MGNLVSSGIFVFFISSILSMILITVPALIGGAVIYHFSYKDIYDHEKYSRYPSIMKGTIIGGAGSLLISIPILTTKVLESHLYSLYMLKLFALIAFIVACVAGALAGRRIHNKLMIEKGSNQ